MRRFQNLGNQVARSGYKVTVRRPVGLAGTVKILSRRRSRIHAKVPFPNDNRTFSCGTKILVESVFSDTGLNDFLDGSDDEIFSNFCPIIRRLRGMKSSSSSR